MYENQNYNEQIDMNMGGMSQPSTMSYSSQPDASFMQFRLDPEEVIQEILHYLRGERWSEATKAYTKVWKPKANEKGVNMIASILYSHLNKLFFDTQLSDEDIRRICLGIRVALIEQIFFNYIEYEINPRDRGLLVRIVDNMIYAGMRRSLNGTMMKSTGRQVQRVENVVEKPTETRSLFNLFGKR